MKRQLILGTESFMKNLIFEKTKLEYERIEADIDESVCDHMEIKERVKELSRLKSVKLVEKFPEAIIITADTMATNEKGEAYKKPANKEESFNMAMSLSGKTTKAHTGVTFYSKDRGYKTKYTETEIEYQSFSEETLSRLIEGDKSSIRSGGLGFYSDSPGFTLVKSFNGSYTGAMGIPMELVYEYLSKLES